jgi:alpha-glucosidase
MPVNRMLPINYTFDNNVYDTKFENEFFFGDNLLVCVVESNKSATEVYLQGTEQWYRLSNDKEYTAGSQFVPSPLDDLPVFVKAGGIVPMQSVVQNTKEKGDGILYLHVWKGNGKTSFVYYEDDGETYNYEKNLFYKRAIVYDAV